ncbi:MAG: hypothetical protein ACJA2X_001693 [Halocynthiibacter sp.]|jgi:hypothetical protein
MDLIADILLVAGALGAGFYCFVLARRLTKFTDLEKGVGGAIAVLSAQVDDMTKTLGKAQRMAGSSGAKLEETTARAEDVAIRIELLIASMHDLPIDPIEASAPAAAEPTLADAIPEAADIEDEQVPETLFLSQRTRVEAAE